MKLVEAKIEDIGAARRKYSKVQPILEEFWLSDMKVAKVEIGNEYKSVSAAQSSFLKAIKRMRIGVFAVKRGDVLYLVKEEV